MTQACNYAINEKPQNFIPLVFPNYDQHLDKVAELYKNGNSLRGISILVDLSKTKVRDIVLKAGIPLRPKRNEKAKLVVGVRGKRNIKPSYRYWFLDGVAHQHPKEYPIVLEIIEQWKSGQSMNSITTGGVVPI